MDIFGMYERGEISKSDFDWLWKEHLIARGDDAYKRRLAERPGK